MLWVSRNRACDETPNLKDFFLGKVNSWENPSIHPSILGFFSVYPKTSFPCVLSFTSCLTPNPFVFLIIINLLWCKQVYPIKTWWKNVSAWRKFDAICTSNPELRHTFIPVITVLSTKKSCSNPEQFAILNASPSHFRHILRIFIKSQLTKYTESSASRNIRPGSCIYNLVLHHNGLCRKIICTRHEVKQPIQCKSVQHESEQV